MTAPVEPLSVQNIPLPHGSTSGDDWSSPDDNGVCVRSVDWGDYWNGDTVAAITGIQRSDGKLEAFVSAAFTDRDGDERVVEISDKTALELVGVLARCLAEWPEAL